MKRYLAHSITIDGEVKTKGLSLLTINSDMTYTIEPFVGETHSTVFVNGDIDLTTLNGRIIKSQAVNISQK